MRWIFDSYEKFLVVINASYGNVEMLSFPKTTLIYTRVVLDCIVGAIV